MTVEGARIDALVASIDERISPATTAWPGGYPHESEAALIDAVFSIRARYGSPGSGVRRVVNRWREYRGEGADDLSVLAATPAAEVVSVLDNDARVNGRPKSAVVMEAAGALTRAGLHKAADLTGSDQQRQAYLSVKGGGPATWTYFTMLLGKPGVKADTWIVRFVGEAVGGPVTPAESERLVTAAARRLGVDPTALDHAIWRTARRR